MLATMHSNPQPPSTALFTDRYELTMIEAALQSGTALRRCVFEVFARRLSGGRRYGVVAGTGRLLEKIANVRFDADQLEWLLEQRIINESTAAWLAAYRFNGTVSGYAEGDVFFPHTPVLTVEGTFAEAVLLETLVLSVLNHDSAVATAASRMVRAAGDRPVVEMGSRRTAEHSAVAAARAAYIAGFAATSNLAAGKRWGIPTMGTAAHAFTLLHDSEEAAFQAQLDSLGPGTTLLVDTYDIPQAVERAVRLAGPDLGAVRIDSGDLPVVVATVREQLDRLGATHTRITVTNDLDEFAVAALAASPVDAYGVGTSVVTGSGTPTMGMVYKLVAREQGNGEWVSVAKRSAQKGSRGGVKHPVRVFDEHGVAVAEHLRDRTGGRVIEQLAGERDCHVKLIDEGVIAERFTGVAGVAAARALHAQRVAELPADAGRLMRGDPVLPTLHEDYPPQR